MDSTKASPAKTSIRNYRLGFLLLCFSVLGGTSSDDPLEQVTAFVGLPVILPCEQTLPGNAEIPTIEWSKPGLKPSPFVFVYRDYDMFEEKHEDFKFRTHLFIKHVHEGNFSMRLSDVRESDAGIYHCKTIWNTGDKNIKTVQLVVGIIPTPELSVVSAGSGEVNLSCQVHVCSLNLPRLTLRDGDGRALEADKDRVVQPKESGCSRLEQRFTAPTSAKSVVCRAEFAEIGQSRDAHMLIPGVKQSCTFPMVLAGIGTGLVVILIVVGLGFLIHKCCCKSDNKKGMHQQASVETTTSGGSESNPLLPQKDSCTIEMEETKVTTMSPGPPDVICSTPNSTVSKADSRAGSVFDFLADVTDNAARSSDAKTATCEINGASKSVKYEQKEEERRTKLTRQDAISPVPKPPHRKGPVQRSRSVSDSCSTALGDLKTQCRRYSLSGSKFDKLLEEL